MIHPRIKWMGDPWHEHHYGFYRPSKKLILINCNFAASVAHPDLIKSVIAHEYVHYLQDLYWSIKDWNNTHKMERFAMEIESFFIPEGWCIDIDKTLREPLYNK